MKIFKMVSAAFDRVLNYMAIMVMVIIVLQMFGITAHVIMRYFLQKPWQGTLTFGEISILWILFLGAAWVLREEKHVKLDILTSALSAKNRFFLNSLTSFLGAITMLIVVSYSTITTLKLFRDNIQLLEFYEMPQGPVYLIIPIGSAVLFIQFLRRAYHNWKGRRGHPVQEATMDKTTA